MNVGNSRKVRGEGGPHLFAAPNSPPLRISQEAAEPRAPAGRGEDKIGVEEALGRFEVLPQCAAEDLRSPSSVRGPPPPQP